MWKRKTKDIEETEVIGNRPKTKSASEQLGLQNWKYSSPPVRYYEDLFQQLMQTPNRPLPSDWKRLAEAINGEPMGTRIIFVQESISDSPELDKKTPSTPDFKTSLFKPRRGA